MKSPGPSQELDPHTGRDLDPMLRDLKSLPMVSPSADFEQSVLDRLAAEPDAGRRGGKRFVFQEFLFKGSRLGVLSGSLAVVFLLILGIRFLQSPETRHAAPDLHTTPQFVPSPPTSVPQTPVAPEREAQPRQNEGAINGISPQLKRNVPPAQYQFLYRSDNTPGGHGAGSGEADAPNPSSANPTEAEDALKDVKANISDKADQAAPAAERSEKMRETQPSSTDESRQRTAVGGAVEFKNEYTPVQGKDSGLLKTTDSTRAAKRAADTQRVGK
ncbi:MAG: hypothetical protein HY962_03840 [Ignavibacteriae bacterium]|nr:hypothetical protein [Ignavibacteriota bacterium]